MPNRNVVLAKWLTKEAGIPRNDMAAKRAEGLDFSPEFVARLLMQKSQEYNRPTKMLNSLKGINVARTPWPDKGMPSDVPMREFNSYPKSIRDELSRFSKYSAGLGPYQYEREPLYPRQDMAFGTEAEYDLDYPYIPEGNTPYVNRRLPGGKVGEVDGRFVFPPEASFEGSEELNRFRPTSEHGQKKALMEQLFILYNQKMKEAENIEKLERIAFRQQHPKELQDQLNSVFQYQDQAPGIPQMTEELY